MLQGRLQVGGLGQVFTSDLFLQGVEQGLGRVHADIGRDQDGLELLEQLGIDFAADAEQTGQLAAQPIAGLGETLLQPLRPAGTRLNWQGCGLDRRGRFGSRRFGLEETKHG